MMIMKYLLLPLLLLLGLAAPAHAGCYSYYWSLVPVWTENCKFDGQVLVGNQAVAPATVRNLLINGSMDFDQQQGAAGTAYNVSNAGTNINTLDGWWARANSAASGLTIQQLSSSPPAGFANYLEAKIATHNATVGASDNFRIIQSLEAFDTAALGWGASNAMGVCLQWVSRSSVASAIIGGTIQNDAQNRSFPFVFQEAATASTWLWHGLCVPGDTTGTWPNNATTTGLVVVFALEAGSSVQGSTVATASASSAIPIVGPGSGNTSSTWTGANKYGGSTMTQLTTSPDNSTWDTTGVQLEPANFPSPFRRAPMSAETARVQRQSWRLAEPAANVVVGTCQATGSATQTCAINLPTTMRAAPTCTITTGTFAENIAGTPTTWVTPTAGTNTANVATITTANTTTAGQALMLQGAAGSGSVYCQSRLQF
jgi:hypothetical protein